MTKLPSTARALILSFAAVAVSFTTGIAVAQVFSVRVRSAAREITENSSPSVAWVSNMRGTLRELEVRLDGLVAACRAGRCAPAPARVPALRHTLQGAWEDYRRLGDAAQADARLREDLQPLADQPSRTWAPGQSARSASASAGRREAGRCAWRSRTPAPASPSRSPPGSSSRSCAAPG